MYRGYMFYFWCWVFLFLFFDWLYFDVVELFWWNFCGDLQGLVEVVCFDQVEVVELFFGFGEWFVGYCQLFVLVVQGGGGLY